MPMSETYSNTTAVIDEYLKACASDATIAHMHLAGLGAVADLEDRLKRHYGMAHALCVSNASTGLLAIALALNLRNDEFITTPLTFGASVSGWMLMGNRPVFADVDAMTMTLDPVSISSRISGKTKAILGVDIFGNPCDTKALRKLADKHGLWYIADCAQSLGAYRDGRSASCDADALVVSFTTGKAVFAGEGGAILTNNTELYNKLLWYTQHPLRQKRELGLQLDNEFGLNARIHPLAAIWANTVFDESLQRIEEQRTQCLELIEILNSTGMTENIDYSSKNVEPSFFRLTAAWKGGALGEELMHYLKAKGVNNRIEPLALRLITNQPAFRSQYSMRLPNMKSNCPVAKSQMSKRFCIDLTTIRQNP